MHRYGNISISDFHFSLFHEVFGLNLGPLPVLYGHTLLGHNSDFFGRFRIFFMEHQNTIERGQELEGLCLNVYFFFQEIGVVKTLPKS